MDRRAFLSLTSMLLSIFANADTDRYKYSLGIEPWEDLTGAYPYQLRKPVYEAYNDMKSDAMKDGLWLQISSGYRTFTHQRNIWNQKYKSLSSSIIDTVAILTEITQFTALPGTSRHHWGTDVDITDGFAYAINDPLQLNNFIEGGEYQYLAWWLSKNAHKYDFYQAFTNDPQRTGFKYEPWHYSFAPLSRIELQYISGINWANHPDLAKVQGRPYSNKAWLETYVKNYIFGVDEKVK